jgi:hypothetical protein
VANDPCKGLLEQYIAAMKEQANAHEALMGSKLFQPVKNGEEIPEISEDVKAALRRVRDADKSYTETREAWEKSCLPRGV